VRPRDPNSVTLAVRITPVLRAELSAEAWECERTLSDYVRALLSRRGKWARNVGAQGGWDICAPLPPKIGSRAARERGGG
jgi:glucokinase